MMALRAATPLALPGFSAGENFGGLWPPRLEMLPSFERALRDSAPGAVKPSPRPSSASLRAGRVIPLGCDLASPVLAARAGVQAQA